MIERYRQIDKHTDKTTERYKHTDRPLERYRQRKTERQTKATTTLYALV